MHDIVRVLGAGTQEHRGPLDVRRTCANLLSTSSSQCIQGMPSIFTKIRLQLDSTVGVRVPCISQNRLSLHIFSSSFAFELIIDN